MTAGTAADIDPLASMSAPARGWFERAFAGPTPAQVGAWAAIASGESALVVAPTGSGKTLAAFFSALDRLTREPPPTERLRRCRVLYISPMKALAVDVERNLRSPLVGIRQEAARLDLPTPDVTVGVRTGDTTPQDRRRMATRPPDILITTPESLFLLLTSAAREILRAVDTVIVDEVHAVAGTKRGAHLTLSLERLDALLEVPARRIGLSATVRPTAEVARFLGGSWPIQVVETPVDKQIEVTVEVPVEDMTSPGGNLDRASADGDPVARTSIWPHVEERIVDLVLAHNATLVFANSRRLAERLTGRLNEIAAERQPDDSGAAVIARAHHGSVSKEQRNLIEEDLKAGRLPAVVATSSLELGIDMGAVDLVIQVESPPSVASGLQRIGRAGHQVGAVSHGTILPKFRGDLLQTAVVSTMMRDRRIEATKVPENPLDVLAQQMVAMVAMDDWHLPDLLTLVRRAAPFAGLPDSAFDAVLDMLAGRYPSDEFAELRPRLVWNRESGQLTGRPGAQRLAVTSGGTIPDRGLFGVFMVGSTSSRVGELDEEMVYESRIGDVFALGASSWRIEDITHDRVLVSPAPGQPGRVPFWHGDALGRSAELGREVGAFVRGVATRPPTESLAHLAAAGLDQPAAENLLSYLTEQREVTGQVPDDRTLVLERFRDELGDWQVVLHSPFGARVHAPWALAIAAQLDQTHGQDVSVFHSDDGIVLRLPDTDDDSGWPAVTDAILIDPDAIREIVTTQVGGSALFAARFRECAARALLLPKRDPGRRAPLWQQRQRSSQLLSVAARYPSFPIVLETVRECLQDVFDLPALTSVLTDLSAGRIRLHEVETDRPSPFSTSLLFGYVAAYLYEGDSPLAERRAQALTLDPGLLAELLGEVELRDLLSAEAIAAVEAELGWLTPERRLRGPEDLADALRVLGPLTPADITDRGGTAAWIDILRSSRRVIDVTLTEPRIAAIEDAGRLRDALGCALPVGVPSAFTELVDDPLVDLIARYARTHGPFTATTVADQFGIGTSIARRALADLAAQGRVVSGQFRPGGDGTEWCDVVTLRRIRRRSVAFLREQAEPVPAATLASLLPEWHGVGRDSRGPDSLLRAVDQLSGVPLVASSLETLLLPSRVSDYHPGMLDELMMTGDVVWCGAGGLPRGDGWLTLAPADRTEVLPDPGVVEGELATSVLDLLNAGGGWFLHDIVARLTAEPSLSATAQDIENAVLDLMWAGAVTNDTLAPVRRQVSGSPGRRRGSRRPASGAHDSPPRRARGRPGRPQARRLPATLPGRWSVPTWRAPPPAAAAPGDARATRRLAGQAAVLLERHAVVTRSAMTAERVTGGFAAVYRVFTAMEETGGCIRTYAVEGLGAAQFTTPAVVDRLRDIAASSPTHSAVLLAATDPAQAYGAALNWPDRSGQDVGHRPGRKAGAIVVQVGGEPLLYLERGGRTLLTWPTDTESLVAAVNCLAAGITEGMLPTATITKIDGRDALTSPLAPQLSTAGFLTTPRGLRLRAGARSTGTRTRAYPDLSN
jgi:ATP-dependent Lhr-like helicase